MANYTYNDFINVNNAPRQADGIGVYDSNDQLVGVIPFSSEMNLKHKTTEPIYSFGLLSDIHLDTTDYNYSQYINAYPPFDEGEGDFRRALQWFKNHENIKMVCACGDLSQNGTADEFRMPQSVIASELPQSGNIPFFTCTGNHDVNTAGGNGFGTYFLRNFEQSWNGMANFERSSAFNESFCFDIVSRGETVGQFVDHFIFFSMYSYTLGSSASPYNNNDIDWLISKLKSYKQERTFVFTHLFFPDLAGNLGRINGGGGIYPSGNWLGGSQLSRLSSLLKNRPNCIWFSGHSHWKWDLQKYQINVNIDRSEYNGLKEGAWHVHVPSCALPIDSDYLNTNSETESNRVEKPLESQGGVVDVYENEIVIRGIDFNINTSQNSSTTQGFSGDTYVKYLPIACYTLDTTTQYVDDNDDSEGEVIMVANDNIRIVTSIDKMTGQTVTLTQEDNGDYITTIEFIRSSQSCVLTDTSLTSTASAFRVFYESASINITFTAGRESVNVPLTEIDDYFGWLVSYDQESQQSSYNFHKTFDYVYDLSREYSGHTYGSTSGDSSFLGIQINTSSKLSNPASSCWLDNYVTAEERTSFGTSTPAFHIVASFTNLRIQNIGEGSGSTDTGNTPSTVTVEYYDWNEINSMSVNDTIDVVMANPHKTNGYILGHNGTNAVSNGNGFATLDDMSTAVASVNSNNNYHMIITKKQDNHEEPTYETRDVFETRDVYGDVSKTFTVSGTFTGQRATTLSNINHNVAISGYDVYGFSDGSHVQLGNNNSTSTRTGTITITFDGTIFPRTIYMAAYVSDTARTCTMKVGSTTVVSAGVNYSNYLPSTTLSSWSSYDMTSKTITINLSCTDARNNTTYTNFFIAIPNNITEREKTGTEEVKVGTEEVQVGTHTVLDGEPYFTLTSKVGSYSPTGTTAAASWSTTPMHYTIENAISLGTSTDLTSGISASNNTKLIRFKNPSNNYLNAGGGLSSLKYATGTGEWSVWYLGKNVTETSSDYIQKEHFETNTVKGNLNVNDRVQDLGNGYVAVSLGAVSTGFWVTIPNGGTTLQVDDLKVYSGLGVTSGTPIALPQYVGFFEGNNHSGTARYQIANGFAPSTTETGSNGRVQFQTSSSYTGGNITIVMKVKFV